MSGYHPPGHGFSPQYYDADPNVAPSPGFSSAPPGTAPDASSYTSGISENPFHPGVHGPFVQYSDPHLHQNYVDQYDDAPGLLGSAQNANARARRRSAPGEQVKHRRTRSGCFTCRQRRVKCDESHPVCERCRKGSRECIYPDTQGSHKVVRGSKSGKSSSGSVSSPEDHDEEGRERLAAILDDEDEDLDFDTGPAARSQDLRDSSDTPASIVDQSTSPSTEASSTAPPSSRPPLSRGSSAQAAKIANSLKSASVGTRDVQFYLNYFQNHISVHHYCLKRDTHNFIKGDLLAQALKFEPLKYAVVGYAAYFHTLSQPDGRISSFLQYYNESVSRLRISITKNKKQGLATFLTILQLASIEEMLGDWVNLMGHQKAAFEMLIRLYTPESITKSHFLLKVLLWYIRFDLFVGFQSGGESVLGREWYVAVHECYIRELRENPTDIDTQYEERLAYSRLVAKDSNEVFARKGKGLLSDQEFMIQLSAIQEKVEGLEKGIPPTLFDSQYKTKEIPGTLDPDDIVNPYEPCVIWDEPLWSSNFLLLDTWGIVIMYKLSSSMALRKPFDPELTKLAYSAAQIFEAICAHPQAPPGAIIEAQVTLALATLFLPRDPKTIQWCRRTFAKVESSGYIYSDVMRARMLESYGVSPSDWWLPDDEGCPPIIRSIKDFIHERATTPKDQVSDDLKEMRGIFGSMIISDSPDSVTITNSEYTAGTGSQANSDAGTGTERSPGFSDWGSAYAGDRKQSGAGLGSQYSVQ